MEATATWICIVVILSTQDGSVSFPFNYTGGVNTFRKSVSIRQETFMLFLTTVPPTTAQGSQNLIHLKRQRSNGSRRA